MSYIPLCPVASKSAQVIMNGMDNGHSQALTIQVTWVGSTMSYIPLCAVASKSAQVIMNSMDDGHSQALTIQVTWAGYLVRSKMGSNLLVILPVPQIFLNRFYLSSRLKLSWEGHIPGLLNITELPSGFFLSFFLQEELLI
jgi:hypothetical protein